MFRYRCFKKIAAGFLALAMIITMLPFPGQMTLRADAAATITVGAVNTGKLTIPAKSKYKLESKASSGKLKYKSSKPKVVKVSKKGIIKGIKPGKAVITIKGTGASKKIKVTVVKKKKYKKVKRIIIRDAPSDLTAGDSFLLKVAFTPSKASNKNLKFKSSDHAVAEVNPMGVIEAKAPGTATITAVSCADKKAAASVTIQVIENINRTITFDSIGGSEVPPQTVQNGKKATEPSPPTLENADFAGWYLEDTEEPFSFSTPIREDITLHARWEVQSVSADGQVDPGDLATLENAGKIQVMTNGESSTPRSIIGPFTEEKILDTSDAKQVLESMKSIFNRTIDKEGNAVEVDFQVKESDIKKEEISTPPDETGFQAPDEVFYRYSPTMPDGTSVEGGDIIICTDSTGNVTGMNATYNPAIYTLERDPEAETDLERIRIRAIDYVYSQLDSSVKDSYDFSAIYDPLDCQIELVVNTGLEVKASSIATTVADTETKTITTDPFYVYKVRVSNHSYHDSEPDHSDPDVDPTGASGEPSEIGDEKEGEVDVAYNPDGKCVPAIDWTVNIDADDYETVHSAYNNFSSLSWKDDRISLTRSIGDTRDTDLRYKKLFLLPVNQYSFYDNNRGISVFPLCTRELENGNFIYGPINRDRTESLKINCTAGKISTWNLTANTLLSNAETVYEFYDKILRWKSYDGNSSNVYIGYYDDPAEFNGTNANAAWWGKINKISFTRPVNGIDYSRCLDTVGHEFTHGVINHKVGKYTSSGLKREGQSGSIEEAYCDIMGELIQKLVGEESANSWEIAENRSTDGTLNSLRSFSNPTGKYHSYFSGTNDEKSFYNDCTILTHAFYLMATNPKIKNQITLARWSQLFYRSISRLSVDSKFIDARYAILAEAAGMRFTGEQQYVINQAFDDVGIKDPKKVTLTLTWGKSIKDLDLYLVGPSANSYGKHYYEVSYRNKIISEVSLKKLAIVASLDQDCRTTNGTEVIQIHKLREGNYYCIVRYEGGNNSMQSTALAKSGAELTAKYGNKTLHYYPHSDSSGTCWLACIVKVDTSGNVSFWRRTNYYSDGSGSLYRYGTDPLFQDVYNQY